MALTGLAMVKAIQAGRPLTPPAPWVEHMRLQQENVFEIVEPGHIVLVWTPGAHCAAADGYVIGGMIAAQGDGGQGLALIASQQDELTPWWTVDLHTRFIRPIKVGESVRIESHVLAKSKASAVAESTFTLSDGQLAARVTGGWRSGEGRRTIFAASANS